MGAKETQINCASPQALHQVSEMQKTKQMEKATENASGSEIIAALHRLLHFYVS